MADGLIAPHGGTLVDRMATGAEAASLAEQAKSLPKLALGMRPLSDLEMIAVGAFSPITGFMGKADYESVRDTMHLANGAAWSLPVVLAAKRDDAKGYVGKSIALTDEGGTALAVMDVQEAFDYDKQDEARKVYRTDEDKHPGVAAVYAQEEVLIGGPIKLFQRQQHTEFLEHRRDPRETRAAFELGWKTRGFRPATRARAHEYIRSAPWDVDGLLHPWSAPRRTTTSRQRTHGY